MRIGQPTSVARLNIDETVTGLWTFANALGLLTDDIGERSAGAGVTVDGLLIRDAGIPEAAVTAHEAALAVLESQIVDGALLARLAAAETVAGAWLFQAITTFEGALVVRELVAAASNLLVSTVTGDAFASVIMRADGRLDWGDGAGGRDTNLFRNAANELKTDDALTVALDLTAGGARVLTGRLRETLNASGDDIDVAGIGVYDVDANGAQDITGFANGIEGQILVVLNREASTNLTLKHANAGSAAGNRLVLGGDADVVLTPRNGAVLFYSDVPAWYLIATV